MEKTMNFILTVDSLIFTILGLIHFYWAAGGKVGLDKALPTTTQEVKIFNPEKFLTMIVGFVLLFFAYIVLRAQESIFILSILFAMRAVGDFHYVGFFKKIKSTPFAIYDTKYFSPLCLYLSLSLAFIAYNV